MNLKDMPFANLVYPDDLEMLADRHQRRLQGEPFESVYPFRYVAKDGRIGWVEISAALIDWEGKPATLNFLSDITERKRVEDALRESEERVRTAMENAPDGIYMNDFEGNFLYGNRRCEEIIGYKREELIGKNFLELNILPEDSLARAAEILQDNINGKSTGPDELELISKDGRRVPIEINTSVVQRGGKKVVLAFVRDITERKKAEAALRENEEKYRNLFDNAMEAIFVAQAGKIVFLNPQMLKMTGYSSEEIMGKPFAEFIHPDDREMVIDRYTRWLMGEAVPLSFDFRGIKKDGDFTWVQFRGVLITWEGRPATLNFLEDITERKQAEEALRESEEKYRSLVENINDVLYTLDTQGNITYVSPVVERFSKYKVSDLIGKPFIPLIYPDDLPALLDRFTPPDVRATGTVGIPHSG